MPRDNGDVADVCDVDVAGLHASPDRWQRDAIGAGEFDQAKTEAIIDPSSLLFGMDHVVTIKKTVTANLTKNQPIATDQG